MLLLIKNSGIVQGNVRHLAEYPCLLIIAGAEHSILKEIGTAHNGLEALLGKGDHAIGGIAHLHHCLRPALPQQGDIRAGDHAALGVHHAEAALRNLF